MTKDELQAAYDEQAQIIAALEARIATEPAPSAGPEYPRIVYLAADTPGQIDHPGFLARPVADPDALAAALADGWRLTPSAA